MEEAEEGMFVEEEDVKVDVVKFEDNDDSGDSDEFEGEGDDDDYPGKIDVGSGGGEVGPAFNIRLCSESRWRDEQPNEEMEVPMDIKKKSKPRIMKTRQVINVHQQQKPKYVKPTQITAPKTKPKSRRVRSMKKRSKAQMDSLKKASLIKRLKRTRFIAAGEDPPSVEEMLQNYDNFLKTKVKLSYEARVNENQLHCLICYKVVEGQVEVKTMDKIQENLNAIFILRKMLDVPNEQLQTYLKHCNGPSNWIGFCEGCQPLIKDALDVNDKIVGLMKQLEKSKTLVVDKIRENVRRKEEESASNADCLTCGKTGCNQEHKSYLTYKIRKHVTKNTYVSTATVFEGGDNEAKTKLGAYLKAKQVQKRQHVLLVRPPPPPKEERCHTPTSPEHSPAFVDVVHEDDVAEVHVPSTSTSGICTFNYHKISKEIPVQTGTYAQSTTPLTLLVPVKTGITSRKVIQRPVLHSVKAKITTPLTLLVPVKTGITSRQVAQMPVLHPAKEKKRHKNKFANRYSCPTCPQLSQMSLSAFLQHIGFHQQRPNKCAECFIYLPSDIDAINSHWNELHKDASTSPRTIPVPLDVGDIWECQTCELRFSSEEELDDHEVKVHDTVPNKTLDCKSCPKKFCSILDWQFHRAVAHPRVAEFSCFYCDETFGIMTKEGIEILDKKARIKHLQTEHSDLPSMSHFYVCRFCGQCFSRMSTTKTTISEHIRTEHKVEEMKLFPCSICSTAFKSPLRLQAHIRNSHLPNPVQVCDVCGWNSKRQLSVLHQHRFKEHGITPPDEFPLLKCDFEGCSFQTVLILQMTSHKRRHLPMEERPYPCEVCSKRFCDYNQLNDHMDIHRNATTKPFQCEVCGASFAVKNYLYIHMRLSHEGRFFPSTHKKKPRRSRRAPKASTVQSSNDMAEVECNTDNHFEGNETQQRLHEVLLNNSASASTIGEVLLTSE